MSLLLYTQRIEPWRWQGSAAIYWLSESCQNGCYKQKKSAKYQVHAVLRFLMAKHWSTGAIHQEICTVYTSVLWTKGNEVKAKSYTHNWVCSIKVAERTSITNIEQVVVKATDFGVKVSNVQDLFFYGQKMLIRLFCPSETSGLSIFRTGPWK